MSLGQALSTATAGLRTTQSALSLVAANVANAETPGYVRKTLSQVQTVAGDAGIGVRATAVNRELDLYVQRQLQTETSGGAYADLRAQFYQRLQQIYGQPGSNAALETVYNNFSAALQSLSASPDSNSARSNVLATARALTQQLNGMTSDVQSLRSDAELGLGDAVTQANQAMDQIAQINQQLGSSATDDAATAVLKDQRDNAINRLARLMDVRTVQGDHNEVSVFTNSGIQLVGTQASKLSFDAKGTMTATSQWNLDPAKRTTGTLTLTSPNGSTVDLVANKSIRSGQIAALLEMRDQVLPEAQSQLDQIAAAMASALSDRTIDGTAVTAGPQSGFDVDIGSLSAGNNIRLTYTDVATNTQRAVTIVRVDDPAALPLPNSATPNPNDKVIGVNFSGGMAAVVAQLNAALGSTGLQFSNPSGTTLRVLDDGLGNKADVDAIAAIATATTLTGGSAELPFFLDVGKPYTGAITSNGLQSVGLAGRISVNAALLADPTRLVVYQTSPLTAAGDSTRPDFLYDRLTNATLAFSPQAGVGTVAAPFAGTLPVYMRQMISQQGEAADAANSLQQGQDIVVNSLQQRFNDSASVNVDTEMANLLSLQTAYSANARVMTTIRDMLNLLLQM